MASRIVIYEAGATATFVEVDPVTKVIFDGPGVGTDYRAVNPLGLVPALRTDAGDVVTENAAVLQHLAAAFPASRLGAGDGDDAWRLATWLSFVSTELHRPFAMLLDRKAHDAVHAYARDRVRPRLDHVAAHLAGRDFLLDRFTVADAYLAVVATWARATKVTLDGWPVLAAYVARMHERPSVKRALAEEVPRYQAELARHA